MGKVLIQVGASEEARAAVAAGVPAGRALVLPRSNVPDDVRPVDEAKPAAVDGEKAAQAESKPEVRPPANWPPSMSEGEQDSYKPTALMLFRVQLNSP